MSEPSDRSTDFRASGRYRLGEEIGRGALGRVMEAWDPLLKRDVAAKLLLDKLPSELRQRFVREAELTAGLEHPNIVPVHDFVAAADGRGVTLVMKRVHGRDLATLLKALERGEEWAARAWSRPRLLAVLQDICLGVAYAHARGVLHRDLKPANVMIGDYGETLILDWGLAKAVGERGEGAAGAPAGGAAEATVVPGTDSSGATMAGAIVGTPSYMSPEQAAGLELDERTDVFSLGVILFEILTYRRPVEAGSGEAVIERTRQGPLPAPSDVVRPPALPVPPELDAICRKAMAYLRKDRYAGPRELHDEIQLFLEGVRERERRAKEARERVEAGKGWFAKYRALREEIAAQEGAVRELHGRIKPWQPIDEKRPLWEAEARLRELRDERIGAYTKATAEFGQALVVDAEAAEARDGLCELFLDRFLDAEKRRDRDEMLLHQNSMAPHDREGKHAARLEAPGRLTLRAFAYGCGCLRRAPAGWRAEIAAEATVPWRDGGPGPGAALRDDDWVVPVISQHGGRWGHGRACARREVTGVEVSIARYEERGRRLVPGAARALGRTPLDGVELARGSWLCTLHADGFAPVRLPVRVDRGGAWAQDVTLYREDEIPAGFRYVPGGPYLSEGPWAGGGDAGEEMTNDVFLATFPVTCAEYLEFLNDLAARGRLDEARARQPREGGANRWKEEAGRFRIPVPGEDLKLAWDPRWPVFDVTWFDAIAFCAWRSERDGAAFSLPHNHELEKATRGVDGRTYAFGDEYDGTFAHTSVSLPELSPLPVDTFPLDESPYGIRGLSGGMMSWCLNAARVPFREMRSIRGGSWSTTNRLARAGMRQGNLPTLLLWNHGFRLAVRPSLP